MGPTLEWFGFEFDVLSLTIVENDGGGSVTSRTRQNDS